MDFLVSAFYDEQTCKFLGASTVQFDPTDYCGRGTFRAYTDVEFFSLYKDLHPQGFLLNDDGLLMADSNARVVTTEDTFPFVYDTCQRVPHKRLDITDLLLYGVQNGGAVFVNYGSYKEGADPILIPFANYRVSASSINIYASYKLEDGSFRTSSLLDLEQGTGKDIMCTFPEGKVPLEFGNMCSQVDTVDIDGAPLAVFKVNTSLEQFGISVGEAFLNYLAYMVAYYDIGRRVLKELVPAVQTEEEKVTSTAPDKPRRKAEKNVSIVHQYSRAYVDEVVECGSDAEQLSDLIRDIPEANITVHWIERVLSSPWYDPEKEDQGMRSASSNLSVECRECGLKFGLELLTHRYYMMATSGYEDRIPLILNGGGVNGQSAKLVSF